MNWILDIFFLSIVPAPKISHPCRPCYPFSGTSLFFFFLFPMNLTTVFTVAYKPCQAWSLPNPRALSCLPPSLSSIHLGLALEWPNLLPSVFALAVPLAWSTGAPGIQCFTCPSFASALMLPPQKDLLQSLYLNFKYYPPSFSIFFLCLPPLHSSYH